MAAESIRGGGDRKLGDEWQDWDGEVVDTQAGKRLFVGLCAVFGVLVGLFSIGGWYLIAPRLAQWHRSAPLVVLVVVLSGILLGGISFVGVTLLLWFRWTVPRPLVALARRFVSQTERGVFSIGRRLAVDTDRTAHSLIKINNILVRIDQRQADPSKVLVLLPRCLTKEQVQQARELAEEYGVAVAVVAGGELARKRIKEHLPDAIIGVACERDLISGIRDVGSKLRVVGIPNARPNGPCKDTSISMGQLREAIEICTDRSRGRCASLTG